MPEIAKVRYTHDAIIDEIVANPAISQNDLARLFGYTPAWVSIIVNSDAFKERLSERKGELIDPRLAASIEARLESVAGRALDKLMDRLDNPAFTWKTGDLIAAAKLGVGDRNMTKGLPSTQVNNYVVHLPPPAESREKWLNSSSSRRPGDVIDVSFTNPEA